MRRPPSPLHSCGIKRSPPRRRTLPLHDIFETFRESSLSGKGRLHVPDLFSPQNGRPCSLARLQFPLRRCPLLCLREVARRFSGRSLPYPIPPFAHKKETRQGFYCKSPPPFRRGFLPRSKSFRAGEGLLAIPRISPLCRKKSPSSGKCERLFPFAIPQLFSSGRGPEISP